MLCSKAHKLHKYPNTGYNFNGNDSTQLEDWLVDIEAVANLSAKSGTKLAQAKSKGLTHTLITEPLTVMYCSARCEIILRVV